MLPPPATETCSVAAHCFVSRSTVVIRVYEPSGSTRLHSTLFRNATIGDDRSVDCVRGGPRPSDQAGTPAPLPGVIAAFLGALAGLRHNGEVENQLPLREFASLAPLTSLGTGGTARWFCEASTLGELQNAVLWANRNNLPLAVLGGGSNVVFSDDTFNGLVLRVAMAGREPCAEAANPACWRVAAGEPWDDFVKFCCEADLAGVECLSGIPGSVGATPIQNVGAYGQEVCQVIRSVRCLERETLAVVDIPNGDCDFAYRSSRFKRQDAGRFIVLSVEFELRPGAAPELRYAELENEANRRGLSSPSLADIREAVLTLRSQKSMLLDPNDPNGRSCGSFFVNTIVTREEFQRLRQRAAPSAPPHFEQDDGTLKVPSAWLIQHAGFDKGHREGNVGLSTKHTLCVVAHSGATSAEVVRFARRVRDQVWDTFGVCLQPEPVFIGHDW